MSQTKKIGRGRPKKIPSSSSTTTTTTTTDNILGQQENPNYITIQKRGRGRPRKYPPKPKGKILKLPKLAPIPDLAVLMKTPGMASVWGAAQKGKRVNVGRKRLSICTKENNEDLGFPSTEEINSPSSAKSYSNFNSNSDSDSKLEDSWFSDIVIPGPIPDLDELLRDQRIFWQSDFFSDISDDWDVLDSSLN
ncbi:hypothetical protein L484_009335 [Morus notabilis]|uniref:Uncharacterized protein n=1 Tax=Morus notabilis TaxID=981085 RepID=W9R1A3_9ROSA|nr:hypothetical protein L484_009335 [Morus notabilis]